jgi:hypothetical protein
MLERRARIVLVVRLERAVEDLHAPFAANTTIVSKFQAFCATRTNYLM